MEDSYKIKNILKASTILIIAFALIMPGSAAVFNISNEDLAKPGEGQGRLGTTIYVDDDNTEGPWDGTLEHPYQYIQDGIDNANNGDEVYVFNGTYNENVVVFRSIHLVGEDKDITIIDGGGDGTVVRLTADGVYLTDFTIKNSGNDPNNAGINVNSEWNHIAVTNVVNNNYGIRLVEPHNDVYFNNFLGNIENAYDDSSNDIFENYWDDYIGVDDDEDGIGDTPYDITGDSNKDWCPLIHIYGSVKNLDTEEVFITIQNAINDSDTSSGHTISVKNDVYYEHVCIHKSINLIGEDNEETIIDARETDTVVRICDDSVYLTGFTIQNSGDDLHDAGMHVTSDENTIKENIIQNNYHGFYINLSS